MKVLGGSLSKRARELRRRRDKGFFTLGIAAGMIACGVIAKLAGKLKCKKCVKRLLAEKK